MASEKKPSIYSDRSTIGSSSELDEYGVWVKSEPQDLSSVSADSQESFEPSMPAMEELPDFNTDFGGEDDFSAAGDDSNDALADDDFSLDKFDESPGDEGLSEDALGEENLSFDEDPLEIPDLDIPEDEPSGEDFSGEAETDSPDFDDLPAPEEKTDLAPADLSPEEEGFTEISLDDFLGNPGDEGELEEPVLEDGDISDSPRRGEKNNGADLSTQLLMKIADELSSIRTELSTLKKDFSAIRGEAPPAEEKTEAQKKGFFDEEEDEKIALTGDELDNILNTADFTEEAGADATEEEEDIFPSMEAEDGLSSDPFRGIEESPLPDLLSDQDDIIGGEPEKEPEEKNTETEDEIDIDLSLDQPDLDELGGETAAADKLTRESDLSWEEGPDLTVDELKDSEELQQLREEGAEPMTPPPEDTSYLDEEALGADSEEPAEIPAFDEDALDLSGAVIDEPDLSAGITENPLQEPVLDDFSLDDIGDNISIDLDMEEGERAGSPETAEDDTPAAADTEMELSVPGEEPALPEDELSLSEDELALPEDELSIPGDDFAIPEDEPSLSDDEPALPEDDLSLSEDELALPEDDLSLSEDELALPEDDLSIPEDELAPPEDDLSIPEDGLALPEDETEKTAVKAPGAEAVPEEESFDQVIPEGFIVEADDSQVPFEDDPEEADALSAGDIDLLEKSPEIKEAAGEEPEEEGFLSGEDLNIPTDIKQELKTVLSYMDQLLESLPEDKIEEFAKSEYFDTYKKLFKELGLV
jgi:hypothetical protein